MRSVKVVGEPTQDIQPAVSQVGGSEFGQSKGGSFSWGS